MRFTDLRSLSSAYHSIMGGSLASICSSGMIIGDLPYRSSNEEAILLPLEVFLPNVASRNMLSTELLWPFHFSLRKKDRSVLFSLSTIPLASCAFAAFGMNLMSCMSHISRNAPRLNSLSPVTVLGSLW